MKRKKPRKIIRNVIIVLTPICFLILLSTVIAVDEYTLLAPLPLGATSSTAPGLGPYLLGMFKIGIGVAGVLAVVMITIGGVMYMTAEAVGTKTDAKKKINNAIFGLILALSSYLLLNTINTDLTETNLVLEPVPGPKETSTPPYERQFQGTCKPYSTGPMKLCYGATQAACQTHCNSVCPSASEIKYQSPCEDTGGPASCKPAGLGSIMWCGRNTTTKETCEADCENKCLQVPVQVTPCTEIGPGGDF